MKYSDISVDSEQYSLTIPDIGVTLRTLLAVAGNAQKATKRRTWKIVYKSVVIGSIRVKTDLIGVNNGKSTSRSSQAGGSSTKAELPNLDVVERPPTEGQ
jgi:hypothetical protein